MSRFEVTNAQYVAFLGAVAGDDTHGLWSAFMQSNALGGIERSGTAGAWQYVAKAGMADKPVNYVSFWDAPRFANWLHNGTPTGSQNASTTEDGAYTITAQGILDNSIVRNVDATHVIPDWGEWVKAGYYEDNPQTWYASPAQSQLEMSGGAPVDDDGNTGNCNAGASVLYDVGAYTLSVSPWSTFDQGGNIGEWSETITGGGGQRRWLGSNFAAGCNDTDSSAGLMRVPTSELVNLGFRVAQLGAAPTVPLLGPASIAGLVALLVCLGVSVLDLRRRRTCA